MGPSENLRRISLIESIEHLVMEKPNAFKEIHIEKGSPSSV